MLVLPAHRLNAPQNTPTQQNNHIRCTDKPCLPNHYRQSTLAIPLFFGQFTNYQPRKDEKITARKRLDFIVWCDGETQTKYIIYCFYLIKFLLYSKIP
nr:MAG TPA: hypothetical protein [Caudoviricetes sp.]